MTTADVALRAGCKRLRGEGSEALWDCPDDAAVVRLLRDLADADVKSPTVRTLARELVRHVGRAPEKLARQLHAYVLDTIEWRREKVETFQSAQETFRRGFGDCDDHAKLIYAALRALGIAARIVIMNGPNGKPAHAVTQAELPGRGWTWLETSVPAHFGEAPLAAAARLGLHTRLNMPPGLAGLAGLAGIGAMNVSGQGVSFDGPIGLDVVTGAAVGAAICSPLGTAIGAVVGLAGSKGFGHGASVGSGVGALVGAVAGGVFAVRARAAVVPATPAGGGK